MSKNIDIERLKIDLAYWNEVAPEGATHFLSNLVVDCTFYKKICTGVWEVSSKNGYWYASCSWEREDHSGIMVKKPKICPVMWAESESYRKGVGTPINAFYYVFPKSNNKARAAFFAETLEVGISGGIGVKANGDEYHIFFEFWDYVEALEDESEKIPSEGDYVVVSRLTEDQHDWIGEKWVEWGIGRGECGLYYDCSLMRHECGDWLMGVKRGDVFYGSSECCTFEKGRDLTYEMLSLWRDAHSEEIGSLRSIIKGVVGRVLDEVPHKKIGTFYHSKNFEQMDNAKVVEAHNVDECLGSLRLWLDEHPETRLMAIWDKLTFDGKTYDVEIGVDVVC